MKFVSSTPAKLNLSLAVTGKKDGLHRLDMIMYPYEKYEDRVEFYPVEGEVGFDVSIADGFDGLDKDRFLAVENPKLQNIAKHFDVGGTLVICKGVPLGAGLGGSSATIACTVKAVAQYIESKEGNSRLDVDFLLSLGSDVPYMVKGGVCRVSGVGEVVERLSDKGKIDVCEIIADGGSDSGACYKLFDQIHGENFNLQNIPTSVDEALCALRNDLFEPACILNPRIKKAYDALKKQGFDKVLMSGSGSTVFAIKGFEE